MNTNNRVSGILLHPTSLPSPYGIGDLGKSAYEFVDFLEEAGQHLWQILPLSHTGFGDSPYQSFSAFAGQPLLISPDYMVKLGFLTKEDLKDCPKSNPDQVDYGTVIAWKNKIFKTAFKRYQADRASFGDFENNFLAFIHEELYWVEDYALFMACKDENGGASWLEWDEEYRIPSPTFTAKLRVDLTNSIEYYEFLQFIFFSQWHELKEYANKKEIQIMGDIPIFVSMDSADVWSNKHLFQLDSRGYPSKVAGVPPDYFCATGQLWGNPIYNWDAHRYENFGWWISRIRHQLKSVDLLRVDHFRGFEACWNVPYGEETAINGEWVKTPGYELFEAVRNALGDNLPIVAEDLGVITDEVTALRKHFNFPGMKVLQFGFESTEDGSYLPHNYESSNYVCYTGTHDNDTTIGWFGTLKKDCQDKLRTYTRSTAAEPVSHSLIRTCIASVAKYAIFPLQDALCCGSEARMNRPGYAQNNWCWRFKKEDLTSSMAKSLKELNLLYGRYTEKPLAKEDPETSKETTEKNLEKDIEDSLQ